MVVKGTVNGRLETRLREMEMNQQGFTVPWALKLGHTGELHYNVYLDTTHTVYPSPGGTVQLHVKRIGPRSDDFEVDLDSVADYKWPIEEDYHLDCLERGLIKIGEIPIF